MPKYEQLTALNHFTTITQQDIDIHNECHKRYNDAIPIRKAVEIRRREIVELSKQPERTWIMSIMYSNYMFLYGIMEATR